MQKLVRFDRYDVDLAAGQIRTRGMRVRLREKSFQVLASLLERPGQVVTREQLRRRLWSDDVFVDFDNNLNTAVARLRQALGDSADHPRFIETLPRHGYRFLATVSRHSLVEREPPLAARLVVLPFLNLSGDPAEESFSDAVTDEVIGELACLAPAQLAVIARTTAMHYKHTHKAVGRICRELGVEYALEGGVRRTGSRVALNAQLVRCDDQMQVLARKVDVDLAGILEVERFLAQEVAAHIGIAPEQISPRSGE